MYVQKTSETGALAVIIASCLISVFRAICKTINNSKVHGCVCVTVHTAFIYGSRCTRAHTHLHFTYLEYNETWGALYLNFYSYVLYLLACLLLRLPHRELAYF